MTATALRPRYYESHVWFEMLCEMERPAKNGIELTVIRNDQGIVVMETEDDRIENYAVCRTIEQAYDTVRAALIRHPEFSFYMV
jgi:hypothetical protein